jgi:7,8-dihydro-6-hydroxymethylpterin dimethyltransferase
MLSACQAQKSNRGFCEKCHQVVPVARVERDGCLYIARDCPKCGHNETLVSRDPKAYYEKREMLGYSDDTAANCALNCVECTHGVSPYYVVVDVTNRCNMNCPICLANVHAMGMEFNPPIEYFDRIFQHLQQNYPGVKVDLFGGEPTCREDLVDIIKLAINYGLSPRVVTNGLKFADEEYCKNVFNTKVQLMLGLDGLNSDIQKHLRKNPGSLQKKLKAIENIEKHIKSKICVMCTTAPGISDQLMPELFDFMYQKRKLVSRIMLIPIQANAGPEKVDVESATIEDVEHMMEKVFPGFQFVPVGALRRLTTLAKVFDLNMMLGGTHPNCECVGLMVGSSDTGGYRPAGEYLKVPFKQFVRELMEVDKKMGPKVENGILGRLFGKTGKRIHLSMALFGLARRHAHIGKILGKQPVRNIMRGTWEKMTKGGKWSRVLRKHIGEKNLLQVVILPYEEPGCLESTRLVNCPVSFVCEHPETGEIDLIPFCSYFVHKNDILRKSAARWSAMEEPA